MTISEFDDSRLDFILKTFDELKSGNAIKREHLLAADKPKDWRLAIDYLTMEGYLKEYEDYFEITYKGKSFIHDGGFRRKHIIESAQFYGTIVAAFASVVGLIISIIALCC